MFKNRSKHERLVHTVRIDASGGRDLRTYGFCIKPPINVLDPEFMGRDFKLTFSDSEGTYGIARVPNGTIVDRSSSGVLLNAKDIFSPIP